MRTSIQLLDRTIEFTLKHSKRARHVRLAVYHGGSFVVTSPLHTSRSFVENFIRQKARWIIKNVDYLKQFKPKLCTPLNQESYQRYKQDALKIVEASLAFYNEHYKLSYQKVTIRNQKSRWGSCSHKGNLSFNYKIALLPKRMADYIVVHELCHLAELNHSAQFWRLVAQALPDYAVRRQELKSQDLFFY